MTTELIITKPDDWHLHLRDGDVLADTTAAAASQVKRAIIMPNLTPPVTDAAQALAYRNRILAAAPPDSGFEPLMTLYLTPHSTPAVIDAAKTSGIKACKLYPAGATTNSSFGVSDITALYPTFARMQEQNIYLLLHGESIDPTVDIFEREKVFLDTVLIPLRRHFPQLKIVLEHLTTKDAADYILAADDFIAATITPQHLLYNRNNLLSGGLKPHLYCLPILKARNHQQALLAAATGGSNKFFAGTDSAPHSRPAKEAANCCAGCYSSPVAIAIYTMLFEQADKLSNLETFLSLNGAGFYGLEPNKEKLKLVKQPWQVPDSYPYGNSTIIPLMAGQTLPWQTVAL